MVGWLRPPCAGRFLVERYCKPMPVHRPYLQLSGGLFSINKET